MRILFAVTALAIACGGPQGKKEGAVVEGADVPQGCCCKTMPTTAEKEIVPVYQQTGRMECSNARGDCVDDVQCNASGGDMGGGDGNPPAPPVLAPSTSGGIGED